MTIVRGCGTALVTPFLGDDVDEGALRALVRWQVEEGIDFLVACGSTGEAQTLTDAEREFVVATIAEEAAGRVPVVAGATNGDTRRAVDEARRLGRAGASAILSAAPPYSKPGPEGLFRHFSAIADAAGAPLVLYNIPGRSGVNMPPSLVRRLAAHANIVGIKESSGDLHQIMQLLAERPDGFLVYSGDDWLALPVVLAGGDGLVSVVSNEAPRLTRQLVAHALAGDAARARGLHYRLLPLMDANFLESNPSPVKAALALQKRIRADVRLPLVAAGDATVRALRAALTTAGIELVP